jgi:glycosyltransferase involved in cell wall biosynthesis
VGFGNGSLPLVSVVIPTYNYGHYVGEAIDSALAQTYPAVEVIVVDDGSTDDTRERLAVYGDRIRSIHQANAGLSAARNTGIQAAKGQYVAFLDSDDAFHPRKLERQMAVVAADPAIGLVGTEDFSDEPRVWGEVPESPPVARLTLEDIVTRSRFSPSSAVVRADCFPQVGLFDTSLRSVEDREMWIRIAAKYPVALVRQPLTWYRMTPGSMSKNPEKMEHFERLVLDRAFEMPELAGRWPLRRKALGLATAASAWLYLENNRNRTAAARLLRSAIWWPLPLFPPLVNLPLARLRLLLKVFRRSLSRPFSVDRQTESPKRISAPPRPAGTDSARRGHEDS